MVGLQLLSFEITIKNGLIVLFDMLSKRDKRSCCSPSGKILAGVALPYYVYDFSRYGIQQQDQIVKSNNSPHDNDESKRKPFSTWGAKNPYFYFPNSTNINWDTVFIQAERGFLEPSTYTTEILLARFPHFSIPANTFFTI
ncbi:hypothetical protein [Acetobacter senegalensis]|uniref:hypothetical protein n=1 Tax=Acetobacter senegalensis TaxID=446692 RepID=UPI000AE16E8E|nr:hypothetical protein [Acetobacter senegalensis]